MQTARKKSESSLMIKIKVIVGVAVFLCFLVLGLAHRGYETLVRDEKGIL
jgi:hypothetical protein